jgi:hypothetical protein
MVRGRLGTCENLILVYPYSFSQYYQRVQNKEFDSYDESSGILKQSFSPFSFRELK